MKRLSSSQGQAHGEKKQCTASTTNATQTAISVYNFLKDNGRKVHVVKGDGNCLFRSMSYELFKTQEHHFKYATIWFGLLAVIGKNSPSFYFQSIVPQFLNTLAYQMLGVHMLNSLLWQRFFRFLYIFAHRMVHTSGGK